jgi:hypothetical protein
MEMKREGAEKKLSTTTMGKQNIPDNIVVQTQCYVLARTALDTGSPSPDSNHRTTLPFLNSIQVFPDRK